jgi:hypothetical protein
VTENGNAPGYDPTAALRALAEAPRVGLEAAAAVIERILTLGRPGTTALPAIPWNGATRDGSASDGDFTPPVDRRVQLRQARADAERVLDAYGDWARQLLDGVFGLAEGSAEPEVLVLGPVRPGDTVEADLWLHAPPGRLTALARLHVTALTAHDGATVPADALAFEPGVLVPTTAGDDGLTAPTTRVRLRAPDDAPAGSYHGHVLVDGLPEIALAVRADVAT